MESGGLLRSAGGLAGVLALKQSGVREMADVRILGSGSFVSSILRQAEALEQTGLGLRQRWTSQELQHAIADFSGVDPAAITSRDRGRLVSSARAMFVYVAREWLGMTGAALGRWLGLSSGSITKAHARGRRLTQDWKLLAHLERKKGSNVP